MCDGWNSLFAESIIKTLLERFVHEELAEGGFCVAWVRKVGMYASVRVRATCVS